MYPQYTMYAPQMPQQITSQIPNNQSNQFSQMNNNGYAIVKSEEEARNYPLGLGLTMTFFDESKPFLYKKTMSCSPLDHPVFEKYEIVKREEVKEKEVKEEVEPEWKADIFVLQGEIENLYKEIQSLKTKSKPMPKKREDIKDDTE